LWDSDQNLESTHTFSIIKPILLPARAIAPARRIGKTMCDIMDAVRRGCVRLLLATHPDNQPRAASFCGALADARCDYTLDHLDRA